MDKCEVPADRWPDVAYGKIVCNVRPLVGWDFTFVHEKIVFVPLFRPGIPCANLPISFPNEYSHSSFYFGRLMRCRYSRSSPVSPSRTKPAKSVRNFIGNRRREDWTAVGQLPKILTAAHNVLLLVALLLLYGCSLSLIRVGPPCFTS